MVGQYLTQTNEKYYSVRCDFFSHFSRDLNTAIIIEDVSVKPRRVRDPCNCSDGMLHLTRVLKSALSSCPERHAQPLVIIATAPALSLSTVESHWQIDAISWQIQYNLWRVIDKSMQFLDKTNTLSTCAYDFCDPYCCVSNEITMTIHAIGHWIIPGIQQ